MKKAVIEAEASLVTFIQIWEVHSAENQNKWLEIMHRRIALLTEQTGFVSMNLHVSIDGKRTAVYAQWTTEELLSKAVNLPEAKQAHNEMAQYGAAAGALYRVDRVYLPNERTKG